MQSAAAAKQVLEGHAMFEGGANVLRLSYSVHRELNVKNSGEKSRDFSLPLGVPSVGYNHPTSHHHAPHAGHDGHGPRYHHAGYADEAQVSGMTPALSPCVQTAETPGRTCLFHQMRSRRQSGHVCL